jgi:hypothetical protein
MKLKKEAVTHGRNRESMAMPEVFGCFAAGDIMDAAYA